MPLLLSRPTRLIIPVLSLLVLASCGSAELTSERAAEEIAADAPMAQEAAPAEGSAALLADTTAAPTAPPQLAKRASLSLTVDSTEAVAEQVSQILQAQQGDLLSLQDQPSHSLGDRRQISIQLRVPQANLEATLSALKELGTVESQAIAAEDVSNQLVDLQARLRNLRQSEAALLEIMDRTGSIAEVLEVSRELSTVRQSIEQIDAQQKALQGRIAYSVIDLSLIEAVPTPPTARPLPEKLETTWRTATRSVSSFTVGLMQMGLWLLAYSPYLAVIAIAAAVGYRIRNARSTES
ncbi:MAG: DUF4349 domain-containing protein [Leptolyngbya sp. SIO4C5]|nr:DUF4349 domain-containing protein [Leptolyngbya sp. SIO4C5]